MTKIRISTILVLAVIAIAIASTATCSFNYWADRLDCWLLCSDGSYASCMLDAIQANQNCNS